MSSKRLSSPRLSSDEYTTIKGALLCLPATCRYHGTELERDVMPGLIEPCCETGGPAMWRNRALAVLETLVSRG